MTVFNYGNTIVKLPESGSPLTRYSIASKFLSPTESSPSMHMLTYDETASMAVRSGWQIRNMPSLIAYSLPMSTSNYFESTNLASITPI